MKNYFNNVTTLEELRKQYKRLVKQYHPDNGGTTEELQEINAEYNILFKKLKATADHHQKHQKQKQTANNNAYDFEIDQAIRNILNQIINLNIDIEIIGNWIWCSNCFNVKDILKGLGFRWASKKKAWYWHEEGYVKTSKKILNLDEIRSFYGSTDIKKGNQTNYNYRKVALQG